MRILLVEDNEANRLIARLILEREGHIVVYAENGEDALKQCMGVKFDLILMDIMMPVLDGIKTLNRLRRLDTHNKDTPAFALTAYCSPYDRKYYKYIGFDHVLVKPLKAGDIEAGWKMQSFLKQHTRSSAASTLLDHLNAENETQIVQHWRELKKALLLIESNLSRALKNDALALARFRDGGSQLTETAYLAGFSQLATMAEELQTTSYTLITPRMPRLLKTLEAALLQLTQSHLKDGSLANHSYGADGLTESGQIQTSR